MRSACRGVSCRALCFSLLVLLPALALGFPGPVSATPGPGDSGGASSHLRTPGPGGLVSPEEMERACRNWIATLAARYGWGGSGDPTIGGQEDLVEGDTLLARLYRIHPRGCVVVAASRRLQPIQVYSDEGCLALDDPDGFAAALYRDLQREVRASLRGTRPGPVSAGADDGAQAFAERCGRAWDLLLSGPLGAGREGPAALLENGPLLSTAWFQRPPYNNFCPMGDGNRAAAGCAVVAMSQIMNYWSWPGNGNGGHSYYWDGDQSCGHSVGGGNLSATFADSYAWSDMPDSCTGGCSSAQQSAVAELIWEVGVALEADWGACGTEATVDAIMGHLPLRLRYDDAMVAEARQVHTVESWFALLREEIDAGRPLAYVIPGHMFVCDGWRLVGEQRQLHANSAGGYGGNARFWWEVDHYPDSPDPGLEFVIRMIRPRALLRPDGSGELPTIQSALNAVPSGGLVELADGLYTGPGNRDLDPLGKKLLILSSSGDSSACVLDIRGDATSLRRGFWMHSQEGPETVLRGFTIRGGCQADGGGILCQGGVSPRLEHLVLDGNRATNHGGGLSAQGAAPSVSHCVFRGNQAATGGGAGAIGSEAGFSSCVFDSNLATGRGGAISAVTSTIQLEQCTLHENGAAGDGGGIACDGASSATLSGSMIVFGAVGGAVSCSGGGLAVLDCCDLYQNAGGDWTGSIAEQFGQNGNICGDPVFCDRAGGDFSIHLLSACAPPANPVCGLIGCLPVLCATGAVLEVSADGSGDFPTIQAAVDASVDSAQIVLDPGTYAGPGNRDVNYRGKAIVIRSRDRDPASCIVDCGGSVSEPHRGFIFRAHEGVKSILEGITITGGVMPDSNGGGVVCGAHASPTIGNCVFSNNSARNGGGMCAGPASLVQVEDCAFRENDANLGGGLLSLSASNPSLIRCEFTSNTASTRGGGLRCEGIAFAPIDSCSFTGNTAGLDGGGIAFRDALWPAITGCMFTGNSSQHFGGAVYGEWAEVEFNGCTFTENSSTYGGAMYCWVLSDIVMTGCTLFANRASSFGAGLACLESRPTLRNSIIAYSPDGEAIHVADATGYWPVLSCCDIYGNQGGDWVGRIAGMDGSNGNIAADPAFCDTLQGNLRLSFDSPCAPYVTPGCILMGAWPVGCDPAAVPPVPVDALALGLPAPNPFSTGTQIAFMVPGGERDGAPLRISILDVSGRLIRTLVDGVAEPGRSAARWDGKDQQGNRVAGGAYFLRLDHGNASRSTRLILLR